MGFKRRRRFTPRSKPGTSGSTKGFGAKPTPSSLHKEFNKKPKRTKKSTKPVERCPDFLLIPVDYSEHGTRWKQLEKPKVWWPHIRERIQSNDNVYPCLGFIKAKPKTIVFQCQVVGKNKLSPPVLVAFSIKEKCPKTGKPKYYWRTALALRFWESE